MLPKKLPDIVLPTDLFDRLRWLIDLSGDERGHLALPHTTRDSHVGALDARDGFIQLTRIDTAVEPDGLAVATRRLLPDNQS